MKLGSGTIPSLTATLTGTATAAGLGSGGGDDDDKTKTRDVMEDLVNQLAALDAASSGKQ